MSDIPSAAQDPLAALATEFNDPEVPLSLADWAPKPICCWCQSPLQEFIVLQSRVWLCPQVPCHTRQLAHAITTTKDGGQKLLYCPLPKQTVAHEAVASGQFRRILYGGAAGGGKSKFLRWLAYSLCLKHKNFRVLLVRRTWPELEETHIREAAVEEKSFGDKGEVFKCTPSNRVVDFPQTGSYLKFGHCQDDQDMVNYLSREYDLILFDELVTFTEKQYLLISSRARTSRDDGWSPMVVAGTNPGGPGAAWVTELFIHKTRDKKKYPAYSPAHHHYIRALLDDNPYVNPTYVEFLMDLDPDLREAYRWGNWDIFPGQYFKEWRATRHGKPWHVEKLHIPPDLYRKGSMDWGYLRPGVFLWSVVLPDSGRLYIEKEWVFHETPPSTVAKGVILMSALWGIQLLTSVGDPAMAIRNNETGEDTFTTLSNNGLPVLPAKHERINGWTRLREWLKPWPDGRPGLIISPDCEYLIRTLPQLMQDSTKLEDVDTHGEDHAADALRYLVMSYPAPLQMGQTQVYASGTAGELFHALIGQLSGGTILGTHNVNQ